MLINICYSVNYIKACTISFKLLHATVIMKYNKLVKKRLELLYII